MTSLTSRTWEPGDTARKTASRTWKSKCTQCVSAKKACKPADRQWPGQKCDRCLERGLACSPPFAPNERAKPSPRSLGPGLSSTSPETPQSDETVDLDLFPAPGGFHAVTDSTPYPATNVRMSYEWHDKSGSRDDGSDTLYGSPDSSPRDNTRTEEVHIEHEIPDDMGNTGSTTPYASLESFGKRPASDIPSESARPQKHQVLDYENGKSDLNWPLPALTTAEPIDVLPSKTYHDDYVDLEQLNLDDISVVIIEPGSCPESPKSSISMLSDQDIPTSRNILEYPSSPKYQRALLEADLRFALGDLDGAHRLYTEVCHAEWMVKDHSLQRTLRLLAACVRSARTSTLSGFCQSWLDAAYGRFSGLDSSVDGLALRALRQWPKFGATYDMLHGRQVDGNETPDPLALLDEGCEIHNEFYAIPRSSRDRVGLLSYICIKHPLRSTIELDSAKVAEKSCIHTSIERMKQAVLKDRPFSLNGKRSPFSSTLQQILRWCKESFSHDLLPNLMGSARENIPCWVYLQSFTQIWDYFSSYPSLDSRQRLLDNFEERTGLSSAELLATVCWMMLDYKWYQREGFESWCESTLEHLPRVASRPRAATLWFQTLWHQTGRRMEAAVSHFSSFTDEDLTYMFLTYLTEKPRPFDPSGAYPHTLTSILAVDKLISATFERPLLTRKVTSVNPLETRVLLVSSAASEPLEPDFRDEDTLSIGTTSLRLSTAASIETHSNHARSKRSERRWSRLSARSNPRSSASSESTFLSFFTSSSKNSLLFHLDEEDVLSRVTDRVVDKLVRKAERLPA